MSPGQGSDPVTPMRADPIDPTRAGRRSPMPSDTRGGKTTFPRFHPPGVEARKRPLPATSRPASGSGREGRGSAEAVGPLVTLVTLLTRSRPRSPSWGPVDRARCAALVNADVQRVARGPDAALLASLGARSGSNGQGTPADPSLAVALALGGRCANRPASAQEQVLGGRGGREDCRDETAEGEVPAELSTSFQWAALGATFRHQAAGGREYARP